MNILPFLTGEHANILVLLCFEDLYYVSELEGIRPRKIVNIKRDALLCLRSACGANYHKDQPVDPFQPLLYMSQRCETDIDNITLKIDKYIFEYINSKDCKYWMEIPRKDKYPTAIELLVFLYANYNCDIPLLPYGSIF